MKIVAISDPAFASVFSAIGQHTFRETFAHLYAREDLDAFLADSHSTEKYHKLLTDSAYRLWLVHDDHEKPVGYGVCGPCTLPVPNMPANSGELGRLYVSSSAQKGGVGTRLLATCLNWLDSNFDHLFLSVYVDNTGAQRLYARHGFEKIHDYHYMVGTHADPEWIMQRLR